MKKKFTKIATPFRDVYVFRRNQTADTRGSFSRLFCKQELEVFGWGGADLQVNWSKNAAVGTIRGLHYQAPPHGEQKVVTCLSGRVWDVFVDLRSTSKTFLKWGYQELSEENNLSILIPKGFAHGFQVLEPNTSLLYVHSEPYNKAADSGISATDPRLEIRWPLPITTVSDRDGSFPLLDPDFRGLVV